MYHLAGKRTPGRRGCDDGTGSAGFQELRFVHGGVPSPSSPGGRAVLEGKHRSSGPLLPEKLVSVWSAGVS